MGGPVQVISDLGGSITNLTNMETFSRGGGGGGGGDIFSDIGNAFTQITQPIEKAVTAGVEDTSKNLTSALQPVEKAVNYIGAHPEMQAAIAFAAAAPFAAEAMTPYLSALGSYAPVASQAIANITVQVAQGVPIEKATENAMVNVGVSGATGAAAQQINKVITSPGVTNAIASTVSSGLSTAARGGSQADVEKAMTAGLAGSTASTIYSEALGVPTDSTGSRVVGTVAKEAALDKTPEQIALSTVSQAGQQALTDYFKTPSVAAPLDQTAAEDARLARQEASIAGSTKGAYLPETPFAMPDQTEAETARLQRLNAQIAGSTKGAYLPAGPVEEPKQGAYLPDSGPEGLVAPEDLSATEADSVTPYKPEIFTATITPKSKIGGSASTEALGQALGTTTGSTTGLTAYRGAGEIEGTGSGKPRKKVWNEESLKLKDALGV